MALQGISQRYIWLRIATFFIGLGACVAAWLLLEPSARRIVFVLAVIAFLIVVALHRRLDGWINRFTIYLDLQKDQLARLELDWSHLPHAAVSEDRLPLDIDLDLTGPRSLHLLLDLAVSSEGSQRLAFWLTHPQPDLPAIAERQAVVQELKPLRRFRQRLLLNLRLMSSEPLQGKRLLDWLEVPVPPRLGRLLLASLVLTALNLVLLLLWAFQGGTAYWIFSFLLLLAFYNFNAGALKEFLAAVVLLDGELDRFSALLRYLERYPLRNAPHLEELLSPFRHAAVSPSKRLRQVKLVTSGVGFSSNPIFGLLLNMLLPWNFLFGWLAARLRPGLAEMLPAWLEACYQLEALASLANFAELHPDDCFPTLSPQSQPVFRARGLRHPLIACGKCVANDFDLTGMGELALVTGSNMAGKSTFLKTIGINLCLACAGGPVAAHSLRCQPFRLHTCMRISDSIADGFSYFYAEVRCLRALLDELQEETDTPLLYLVDEIFRGTNNRERLIGSRAYVKALLGAHGAGLIATHDLELAHIAEQDARLVNYHFRDEIEGDRLVFDYRIRPGSSPTTNALKIMALEGLPGE